MPPSNVRRLSVLKARRRRRCSGKNIALERAPVLELSVLCYPLRRWRRSASVGALSCVPPPGGTPSQSIQQNGLGATCSDEILAISGAAQRRKWVCFVKRPAIGLQVSALGAGLEGGSASEMGSFRRKPAVGLQVSAFGVVSSQSVVVRLILKLSLALFRRPSILLCSTRGIHSRQQVGQFLIGRKLLWAAVARLSPANQSDSQEDSQHRASQDQNCRGGGVPRYDRAVDGRGFRRG